jgi:predicted ABC-type ATPase
MRRRRIHIHVHDEAAWETEARKGKGPGGGEWTAGSGGGGGASQEISPELGRQLYARLASKPQTQAAPGAREYAEEERALNTEEEAEENAAGFWPHPTWGKGEYGSQGGYGGPASGGVVHVHVHQAEPASEPPGAAKAASPKEQLAKAPRKKGDSGGAAAALYAKNDDPTFKREDVLGPLSKPDRAEMEQLFAKGEAIHKATGGLGTKSEHPGQHGGTYSSPRRHVQNGLILHGKDGKSGILSPERVRAATPPPGTQPKFIVLGGRGGSGKGAFKDLVYDEAHSIVLDADEFKGMLPEYAGWNAGQVHEESSDMLDRVLKVARRKGLNVVLDATMKSGPGVLDRIRRFKDEGYCIEAHFMHLPRQIAAQRAVGRFFSPREKGDPQARGRLVDPAIILSNTENEKNFDEATKLVDYWSLWDNSGAGPQLVSHGGV